MNVFIAWEVDRLDGLLSAAMMSDNATELKRISQDLGKAANIIKSWAMASGGCAILDLLARGCVEVPAEKMNELPGIRRQFQAICDGTLSMGVAMALNEAFSAQRAAKMRGGDQIALFVPEMLDEVSEESSLAEDLLGKADGDAPPADDKPKADAPAQAEPSKAPDQPQQDQTAPQEAKPDSDGPAGPQQPEEKTPKAAIMAALKDIKTNADAIEQLKETNPQAFRAVTEVVQAMILMAESMQDAPKE